MTQSSRLKKTWIVAAFCAVSFATVGPAGAASGDPLSMVPADSLFCVRINNLNGTLGQIDMFLSGLIPMGVSMPVQAQLAQFLGSPQPQGVNMGGQFVVFGPLPGGDPDPSRVGILVPVSSYEQFVSGNPNVAAPDAQGFSQIGPQGMPMLTAVEAGGYALVSTIGNEAGLTALKGAGAGTANLAGTLDAAELKRSTAEPVWVYANIELAGKMFGPMIQAQMQQMQQGMQAMQGQGGMGQQAAANLEASAAILDTVMKETKYLSLSLNPNLQKLGLTLVLAGAPGSGMAEMFKSATDGAANKLQGYMQAGAAMNFSGSMNSPFWQKLNEAYIELLPKMMGEAGSPEDVAAFKKIANDAMEAFGGPLAGSFSVDAGSTSPFQVRYVAALKDPAKFYQVMEEASKAMSTGKLAELYKQMGMETTFKFDRNASTYEGVSIDSVTFALKPTETDSPQAQAINAIYGDGLNIKMATVNEQLVYALGQNAEAEVKKLIDQVKAGGPKQVPGEVQSAMAMIPGSEQADFFMTLNVLRIMKLVGKFAPMPVPQTDIPTQSSIAMAADAADGKMTVDLAVPKQHVQEIMGFVMQMQQMQGDDEDEDEDDEDY